MVTTLRTRLALWSAIFFAAAVALLGIFTISLVRKHQIESLDAKLAEEVMAIFHELAEHGPGGVGHGSLVVDKRSHAIVLDAGGQMIFAEPELRDVAILQTKVGAQTVGAWRVWRANENGYTVFMARGFEEVDATVADVRRAFLFTLPGLLLLIGGGAWWLVRSALRPVQKISAAARHISAEHLDERLPVPARLDELGQLTSVLNQMLDRVERGHTQAVRFTADASHELKTPLALLAAGLEELLRRQDLESDVVAGLGSLLEDTRRLAAVCQDLLVLARADAGRLALDRQPHDLGVLAEAAVEDARILGEEKAIVFATNFPPSAEEFVDTRYFTRILLNLLSNAVKYNRDRGIVRVEIAAREAVWTITVANTGPGINPTQQTKLFERFFRADSSSEAPGHGLGLSLSRELARAHGGELALVCSDEAWTVFRLTLPRTTVEADLATAAERLQPADAFH